MIVDISRRTFMSVRTAVEFGDVYFHEGPAPELVWLSARGGGLGVGQILLEHFC